MSRPTNLVELHWTLLFHSKLLQSRRGKGQKLVTAACCRLGRAKFVRPYSRIPERRDVKLSIEVNRGTSTGRNWSSSATSRQRTIQDELRRHQSESTAELPSHFTASPDREHIRYHLARVHVGDIRFGGRVRGVVEQQSRAQPRRRTKRRRRGGSEEARRRGN